MTIAFCGSAVKTTCLDSNGQASNFCFMHSQTLSTTGIARATSFVRRNAWLSAYVLLMVFGVSGVLVAEAPEQSTTAERNARLVRMSGRAKRVQVHSLADEVRKTSQLVTEPLFRYSDEPRRIIDATLWCWQSDGRPTALLKIEENARTPHSKPWLYCVVSLSSELIEVERDGGREFSSRRPGLDLRPLPNGPEPANTKAARLTQLRQLARRFSATIVRDPKDNRRDEMRLLPQPLYRYANPEAGLADAALFGLTATGTNPDGLLAIELHGKDTTSWRYGLARMTMEGLSVRLDNAEVWTAEFTSGTPGPFDTWHWFQAEDETP